MPRYIDADALISKGYPTVYHTEYGDAVINVEDIEKEPTVREITTCAACRFNQDGKCRLLIERDPEAKDHRIYSDFWCAYGEK